MSAIKKYRQIFDNQIRKKCSSFEMDLKLCLEKNKSIYSNQDIDFINCNEEIDKFNRCTVEFVLAWKNKYKKFPHLLKIE